MSETIFGMRFQSERLTLPLKFTTGAELEPFLVVMMMTPFAALAPYRAAADGPERTEIDSMSSWFREPSTSPVWPAPA